MEAVASWNRGKLGSDRSIQGETLADVLIALNGIFETNRGIPGKAQTPKDQTSDSRHPSHPSNLGATVAASIIHSTHPEKGSMSPSLFDDAEIISMYTRMQAIEDGILVDMTQEPFGTLAREAGLKWPIAMTATAFQEFVAVADTLELTNIVDILECGTPRNTGRSERE